LQKTLDDADNLTGNLKNQLEKSITIEHFLEMCEQYVTPSIYMLVKNELLTNNKNVSIKHSSKDKYSKKQLALTLHFHCPTLLNFLRRSYNLPSLRTLKKVIRQNNMKPGLNDFVFNFIKLKVSSFKLNALDCVLYVDQMSLQTYLYYNISQDSIVGFNQSSSHKTYDKASQALVFMIEGVNYKWKQFIAYYLLSSCTLNNLTSIVFSVIRRLRNIDFNILALVSDQSKELVSFSKMMHVSSNRPYFDIDGQRIVYIFNPLTLLRTTCDMFFKYSLYVNNEVIEKKYLDMYYNDMSNFDLCSTVRLTHKHIHPGPFDEINIGLAKEVFSGSVAGSMSVVMNRGILAISSKPTINFINNMHKLFDIFNNPFKNITLQKDHLFLMTELFKQMKVIDNSNKLNITSNVESINGWLVSISGLNMWWETLNPTINREYSLCTHWLNKDFLDSWFTKPRRSNVNNFKLTSIQFVQTFQKLFYKDYFECCPRANVNLDLDQIICKINDLPLSDNIFYVTNSQQHNLFKCSPIIIGTVDYRYLKIPEENILPYISGYLMYKCLQKHDCEICISYAYCQKTIDQSLFASFLQSYSENSTSTELLYQDNFQDYIKGLEYIFVVSFPTVSIEDNVGLLLKDSLCNVQLNHPCNCFDKTFLLDLYIRLRIFITIKFSNNITPPEEFKLSIFT